MEETFKELQKFADDGDFNALADEIAILCYNYVGNRLDMLSESHTFSITSGEKYSITIPPTINAWDLISAAIKHGAAYFPEQSFLQGKFFTFQYR